MRAFLIVVGLVGLFASVPAAIFAAMMHHGFGGILTIRDYFTLFSPLPFVILTATGFIWKSETD